MIKKLLLVIAALALVIPLVGCGPKLAITTASVPGGTAGEAYTATLGASGGTGEYTWSVISGALPDGLSLSSAGVISGTPTAAGTFAFTVKVSDGKTTLTQGLSIVIVEAAPVALAITTASLPGGTVNQTYEETLEAVGGTENYTWSLVSGNLSAGLSLSSDGVISGTPTAEGTSNFTVEVNDGEANVTKALSIVVVAEAVPVALAITTTSLPGGTVNETYEETLEAVGGTENYTWSLVSGNLSAGLSLSTAGVISGTPTAEGTSDFTVQVNDGEANVTKALSIVVIAGGGGGGGGGGGHAA